MGNISRLLIEHNAKVNSTDPELSFDLINKVNKRESSPIHIAAENNFKEMVLLLLMHGADHTKRNRLGEKPEDASYDMRLFISKVVHHKECFRAILMEHQEFLKDIFYFTDKDMDGYINLKEA